MLSWKARPAAKTGRSYVKIYIETNHIPSIYFKILSLSLSHSHTPVSKPPSFEKEALSKSAL